MFWKILTPDTISQFVSSPLGIIALVVLAIVAIVMPLSSRIPPWATFLLGFVTVIGGGLLVYFLLTLVSLNTRKSIPGFVGAIRVEEDGSFVNNKGIPTDWVERCDRDAPNDVYACHVKAVFVGTIYCSVNLIQASEVFPTAPVFANVSYNAAQDIIHVWLINTGGNLVKLGLGGAFNLICVGTPDS